MSLLKVKNILENYIGTLLVALISKLDWDFS
jgi:hypothetical protein